jgi:hypothetical protein
MTVEAIEIHLPVLMIGLKGVLNVKIVTGGDHPKSSGSGPPNGRRKFWLTLGTLTMVLTIGASLYFCTRKTHADPQYISTRLASAGR